MPARPGYAPAHIDCTLHVCAPRDDLDTDGQCTWRAELHSRIDALPNFQLRLEPQQHRYVRVQAEEREVQPGFDRRKPLYVLLNGDRSMCATTNLRVLKDCSGTAQAYFTGSKFAQLAETYGYVVLYPNSVSS